MLGLCLFVAFGPLVEAEDCDQLCTGERECSTDFSCSCCVHFRVDPPRPCGAAPSAMESRPLVCRAVAPHSAPDPREVLHVPRAHLLSPI
jgi:hypothetical protein